MEVRFDINTEFLENLKAEAKVKCNAQITDDALTFYNFLVSEVNKGRILFSSNEDGTEQKRIIFPNLEKIRPFKTNNIQMQINIENNIGNIQM